MFHKKVIEPCLSASTSSSVNDKPQESSSDKEKVTPPSASSDSQTSGADDPGVGSNEKKDAEPKTKDSVPKEEVEEKWSQERMMNLSRKFNLDLAPKLLFSRGPLVELLISSNVARYAEFKCITRVLTWRPSNKKEGELLVVPCSRSDVFTTSSVSLVEKRLLMKFLEFCHSYDDNPEQLQEYADKSFVDFLRSRKLTDNLVHFVTESIAMVSEDVSCREGLEKMKLFLTSLGRYGTTPFLFSMYRCGELPQAFCRLCAVFEGTYLLRRPVSSLIIDSQNSCCGFLSEGHCFKCSHVMMEASYAPKEYAAFRNSKPQQNISRGIFITDRLCSYDLRWVGCRGGFEDCCTEALFQ
ncbi:rab proteins geranylgeranyltransferase component A 2-like isoform X1 [Panulirus ornatus]|uniref:rab proteins geranylgeranyltransferase component A 2-like isoform X1 n=2 Tax=Panulirus ornatus TaxID=150431 RepID=UPI003A865AF6